jgi:hypothetical protein
MGSALKIELSREVRTNGFRGGLEAERGGGRGKVSGVLTSVAFSLDGDVLLLWDQVVDAFFKFHLYQLFF